MPNAHEFGATNKPGTCLYCGDKLKPNYTTGDRVEGKPKIVSGENQGVADYTVPTWKYVNRKIKGYGWESNGFFCTLRCGEEFGKAFARLGRRLQPRKQGE